MAEIINYSINIQYLYINTIKKYSSLVWGIQNVGVAMEKLFKILKQQKLIFFTIFNDKYRIQNLNLRLLCFSKNKILTRKKLMKNVLNFDTPISSWGYKWLVTIFYITIKMLLQ